MKNVVIALAIALSSSAFAAVSPFELPWMNADQAGATFKSSDYSNGIFVVEAYFLGCPYCNDNAPAVDELASKYSSDSRVHVLDVGIDKNDSQYKTWISRHKPNHPVLKDAKRKLIGQLGTQGYPSTYVLDCKGNVVAETSGAWGDEERQTIEKGVEKLQGETCQ